MAYRKKTGVKFCGGCHISYDRRIVLQKIMSVSACIFENVEDEREYDNLLVLCCCTARCAEYHQYKVRGHIVVLDTCPNESEIDHISMLLS